MQRKLVCMKCGKKQYINGTSCAISFMPSKILCWDHDKALQKSLNKEVGIAAALKGIKLES